MKITSNTLSREEFEKMWKDEVENRAYDGFDMSHEGAKLLYVKDDETGVLCCYAQPKKTANAFFVCDVVKRGTQFEVYKTPAGRDHFNIGIKDNDQVIETLEKVVRPSDKKERQALLNVYKRNCPKKETSHFAVAPAVVIEEEPSAKDVDPAEKILKDLKNVYGIEGGDLNAVVEKEPVPVVVEEPIVAVEEEPVVAPVEEEKKKEVEPEIEEVKEEDNKEEDKNEDNNATEVVEEKSEKEPKEKKGCLVKLAATAAAAALLFGAGVVGYKLGNRKGNEGGKEPIQTEDVQTGEIPGTTTPDNIISGDDVVVEEKVEINTNVQDEVYNTIVKNVQVDLARNEIVSTYVADDNQTVFAMTDTELYKIDLTNGGENLGEVSNNEELITKLQATNSVTESYKIDYLLGDKYVEACKEFEEAYKDENTVVSAQAYVSDISLQKAETGKGFMVAPTTTVVSVDAQGDVSFEEYKSDKVTVQRGVQLSGIDMVAASLFTDMGFTSDIYTVENVDEQSKFYDIAVSKSAEVQDTPVVEEPEQEPEQIPEQEPEQSEENTEEPEMTL